MPQLNQVVSEDTINQLVKGILAQSGAQGSDSVQNVRSELLSNPDYANKQIEALFRADQALPPEDQSISLNNEIAMLAADPSKIGYDAKSAASQVTGAPDHESQAVASPNAEQTQPAIPTQAATSGTAQANSQGGGSQQATPTSTPGLSIQSPGGTSGDPTGDAILGVPSIDNSGNPLNWMGPAALLGGATAAGFGMGGAGRSNPALSGPSNGAVPGNNVPSVPPQAGPGGNTLTIEDVIAPNQPQLTPPGQAPSTGMEQYLHQGEVLGPNQPVGPANRQAPQADLRQGPAMLPSPGQGLQVDLRHGGPMVPPPQGALPNTGHSDSGIGMANFLRMLMRQAM